ncbi:hypothetical protein E3E35_08005 [Thermococcus sp. GR7]|uniref:GxxExxY protein n=1 Tax=unclassified Thermococcus TaxID=2627626 RepID=UPI001430A436|nr:MULTISPECIES: GxxExxY protein [unclassified Thermococcus]NJE47342.1 hypothetical protein [Thermococcus sp. GR7]NJE79453.1 hypothetical protein [Thermococcus sp. GR4]NJF23168.1 hypothetical protein [Thermococcus sp. GR5]
MVSMVSEFDMYPYVKERLRKRYPASEGWIIKHRERRENYEPDFVVERRVSDGKIERVIVEVKAVCKVTQEHIDQINRYARNLAGLNVRIIKKILVVPSYADTSIVPPDIEKMYLRKFYCE